MRIRSTVRGYSLVEVLVTLVVLALLVFAVGSAVVHVLGVEVLGANRMSAARSAEELATRMSEEARSSTAVFVPVTDVLGNSNAGPSGSHEVDFFRKASDGGAAFVAYRFDSSNDTVVRYEYQTAPSGLSILDSDLMATGIATMSAQRTSIAAASGLPVAAADVYYGSAQLVGGNGVVEVSIDAGVPGQPKHHLDVHLSSRAAPTDIAVVVASSSPAPSPGPTSTPISVPFLLRSPAGFPHGPLHRGDPGGGSGTIYGPAIPGTAEFYGNGSGNTESWFELTSLYGSLVDGTYSFQDSAGNAATVTISCAGRPCPSFVPMPVPTTGPAILFNTL